MKQFPNLTLKRVLRMYKRNTQDKWLHKIIENGNVERKEFLGFIQKIVK